MIPWREIYQLVVIFLKSYFSSECHSERSILSSLHSLPYLQRQLLHASVELFLDGRSKLLQFSPASVAREFQIQAIVASYRFWWNNCKDLCSSSYFRCRLWRNFCSGSRMFAKRSARPNYGRGFIQVWILRLDIFVADGFLVSLSFFYNRQFNTSNSTVEQRMLAISVFAALNETRIAFQGGK